MAGFWDVRLFFFDRKYRCNAEAGAQISDENAPTADVAIELCRTWRNVTEPLTGVSVTWVSPGDPNALPRSYDEGADGHQLVRDLLSESARVGSASEVTARVPHDTGPPSPAARRR